MHRSAVAPLWKKAHYALCHAIGACSAACTTAKSETSCNQSREFQQLFVIPAAHENTAKYSHVVTGGTAQAYLSRAQRRSTQVSPASIGNHVFLSARIHDHVQKINPRTVWLRTRRAAHRHRPNTLHFVVRCFVRIKWLTFDSPCIGDLSRLANLTQVTALPTTTALSVAMRTARSSVFTLPTAEAIFVVTVVFTTFAAGLCTAAGRTRLPSRFLTLSAHFVELSRLAAIAALRIAKNDTSTCHVQSCRNKHTLKRQDQSPSA